jgi:putative ATP-dependent endonuclease of OLD family
MYISNIFLQNFRNFEDAEISLNPGLNVLIGENNAGKSNLLQAIRLVFSNKISKKLSIHDFFKGIKAFDSPPSITITAIIQGDGFDTPEDKATIAPWLTKLESPWQATLQFTFYLPDKHHIEYQKDIQKIKDKRADVGSYWDNLESYLPKYTAKIFGGNPDSKNRADYELLEKIDCQLLDAIRDVETRMFSGKSPLLRDILEYFLDHDIKKDTKIDNDVKKAKIAERQEKFLSLSKPVVDELHGRISLDNITIFADKTGASKGGTPALCGEICEREVIDALQLMIKHFGFEIPISCNGLGYNNLLFMALLLSKIDVQMSIDCNGDNSIVFPLLLIEEPEAHLHPALQFKFLRFLRDELATRKSSKQIFITTHSTHIAAAVELDAIIVLSRVNDKFKAAYPGKVFSSSDEDNDSKDYVQRYFDATKSNMLFSKGVVLVEGISEQLLIPCFAEYMEKRIEDAHVAVVRVDGLTFKHFIKIYGTGVKADRLKYALETKVACVLDADPKRILVPPTR